MVKIFNGLYYLTALKALSFLLVKAVFTCNSAAGTAFILS